MVAFGSSADLHFLTAEGIKNIHSMDEDDVQEPHRALVSHHSLHQSAFAAVATLNPATIVRQMLLPRDQPIDSPSAKRGKYGPEINPAVTASASQQPSSNPTFPLALSPSLGPSSVSTTAFSQSSSPSQQPSISGQTTTSSPSALHSPSHSRFPVLAATHSEPCLHTNRLPTCTCQLERGNLSLPCGSR